VYQPPGPLSVTDYRLGFTILAIFAGLASSFFLLAKKPQRPLKEG
jgi:hypothetical protein